MNTEQDSTLRVSKAPEQAQSAANKGTKASDGMQYTRVQKEAEELTLPVDFRNVPLGHGPCSCCGPHSE